MIEIHYQNLEQINKPKTSKIAKIFLRTIQYDKITSKFQIFFSIKIIQNRNFFSNDPKMGTRTLNITNPRIIFVPKYFFGLYSCYKISILYLNLEKLVMLQENDLKHFINLTRLTIIGNGLHEIQKKVFNKATKLDYLYLEAEIIMEIPQKIFYNLRQLENVTLRLPNLKMIPITLFDENVNLKILKIDYYGNLEETFFEKLKNISTNLTHLSLLSTTPVFGKCLPHNFCRSFKNLQCLTMYERHISAHVDNNLENFKSLTYFCMCSNSTYKLKCDHLLRNRKLKVINLSTSRCFHAIKFETDFEQDTLQYLNLNYNLIEFIQPNAFQRFKNLTILNLSYNFIQIIKKNYFSRLQNLKMLNLWHNYLNEIEHNSFIGLKRLQYLNLGRNNINYTCSNIFYDLPEMENIHFEANNLLMLQDMFQQYPIHKFARTFAFQWNRINSIGDYYFRPFIFLKYLYLNGNRITNLNGHHFETLKHLVHLDLSHNNIHHLDPYLFSNLKMLQILKLAFNKITFLSCYLFQNLRNLEVLDLSYNKIIEIPGQIFRKNRKLQHLLLNDNNISMVTGDIFKYSSYFDVINLAMKSLTSIPYSVFANNLNSSCSYIIHEQNKDDLTLNNNLSKFKIIFAASQ